MTLAMGFKAILDRSPKQRAHVAPQMTLKSIGGVIMVTENGIKPMGRVISNPKQVPVAPQNCFKAHGHS